MKKFKILIYLTVFILFGCTTFKVNLAFKLLGLYDDNIKLSKVTNDEKEVIFFPMHHLGTKLFYDDVNSGIISPFLKWAFDAKLNSEQYLFTSVSYGLYDWKIKKLSDGSQTNKLFTVQVGGTLSF